MSDLVDRAAPSTAPHSPDEIDWVEAAGAGAPRRRGTTSRTPHVAWTLLGAATVPAAWYAWSVPGSVALLVAIAAAFALWRVFGARGSWMTLVVIGIGMSGVLGWQAATGARCPADGTKVFLKENKPPIGCTDVRASAGAMSAFFGMVALIGIAAPLYARGARRDASTEL